MLQPMWQEARKIVVPIAGVSEAYSLYSDNPATRVAAGTRDVYINRRVISFPETSPGKQLN